MVADTKHELAADVAWELSRNESCNRTLLVGAEGSEALPEHMFVRCILFYFIFEKKILLRWRREQTSDKRFTSANISSHWCLLYLQDFKILVC